MGRKKYAAILNEWYEVLVHAHCYCSRQGLHALGECIIRADELAWMTVCPVASLPCNHANRSCRLTPQWSVTNFPGTGKFNVYQVSHTGTRWRTTTRTYLENELVRSLSARDVKKPFGTQV